MSSAAPFLVANELRAASFVRHVEIYDSLDSTNNRAAVLARDAAIPLPALVAARHQTAGRGRGANSWWSADGALTFSLLIDPAAHRITTRDWPLVSLTTALAVRDTIAAQLVSRHGASPSAEPRIKWPNDVLIADRKIAGILIESPGGAAPAKDRLIVGVGLNVNNSWHSMPQAQMTAGIALCDASARPHDLQEVLGQFLVAFAQRLAQLADGDPEFMAALEVLSAAERVAAASPNRPPDDRTISLDRGAP